MEMNTAELTSVVNQFSSRTHFYGVLASDQLPRVPVRDVASMMIVNTHPSNQPGEHWLAIYITDDGIGRFYDSFGNPRILHIFPSQSRPF